MNTESVVRPKASAFCPPKIVQHLFRSCYCLIYSCRDGEQ